MKTILLVDDEFDLTSTLRAILEGEGYRTEVCANGKEALERLEGWKPELILMDVMMPLVSGFEVLRTIRQRPGTEGIPVILMSSVPPRMKQKDYQWQTFLMKPFTIQAMLKAVEELIGKAGAGEE